MNLSIDSKNIISLLGIETLPDEQKLAIVDKVTTLVEKRLLVKIFESLDGLRQTEFSELLEKSDQAALQDFLGRNVPNMDQMAEQEIAQVKTELADWAESLA
jgi:hypothetical protein